MIVRAETPEAQAAILRFIAERVGCAPFDLVGNLPFEALATFCRGKPRGALLYTNYRAGNIELSAAGKSGWLTPGVVKEIFRYPFVQLNCHNVLSFVKRSNEPSRELCRRLGYQESCVIRGARRADDTVLYVMNRHSCRWIQTDERSSKSSRSLRGRASTGANEPGDGAGHATNGHDVPGYGLRLRPICS